MKFLIPFFSLVLLSSHLCAMENVNKPEKKPSEQTKQSLFPNLKPVPFKYECDTKDKPCKSGWETRMEEIPERELSYEDLHSDAPITITYSQLPKLLLIEAIRAQAFDSCYKQTMQEMEKRCVEIHKHNPSYCYSLHSLLAQCKCTLQLKEQNK